MSKPHHHNNSTKDVWKLWTSGWHWKERIINFTPSWFTVTMGVGIQVQLMAQFPYPAQWLRTLSYCFWILDIILFSVFITWFIMRYTWYPALMSRTLEDFTESTYLGAIPISFDGIITGITIHYADHPAAIWAAYGLFWVSVVVTLLVSCGAVFVMFAKQPEHKLQHITGAWLVCFAPLIVTSAAGAALCATLPYPNNIAVLVVSFFMWSAGEALCFMCTTIYLWRLMSCQLPPREAIISSCIPLGPLGQGAYSIQTQANFLSAFLREAATNPASNPGSRFQPSTTTGSVITQLPIVSTEGTIIIAEIINWMGIIIALFMIGLCTFWLCEAVFSIYYRVPKKFSIGFWGLIFPLGTYVNAVVLVGKDLRNEGLKGWGAACSVTVMLLWVFCASGTIYKGFWLGELFYAPGLEGFRFNEPHKGRKRESAEEAEKKHNELFERHGLSEFAPKQRIQQADNSGSYTYQRGDNQLP